MRETQVQSLGWEDLLEKEMATHSSILAWKLPWTVEPGRPQSMVSQRVGRDLATSLSLEEQKFLLKKNFFFGPENGMWGLGFLTRDQTCTSFIGNTESFFSLF